MLDPDRCPADFDHVAELYLLGQMDAAEHATFEDHYITCAACARRLEEIAEFTEAMREAAERLSREKMLPESSLEERRVVPKMRRFRQP